MSIINLERSYELLAEAAQFVEDVVAGGGKILFVATKKQAQDIVREAAVSVQMPFCVNRWMGGTLTNFQTITSSLKKYKQFLKMEDDGSLGKLPGKEAAAIVSAAAWYLHVVGGIVRDERCRWPCGSRADRPAGAGS